MKRRTWVESAIGCESGMRNQSVRTSSIVTGRSPNCREYFRYVPGGDSCCDRCVNRKNPECASRNEVSAIDDPVRACHKCGAGATQVSDKFGDLVTMSE